MPMKRPMLLPRLSAPAAVWFQERDFKVKVRVRSAATLQRLNPYLQSDESYLQTRERLPACTFLTADLFALRDHLRRKFDVVACWRLDRLGRNLKHLIVLLEELQTLGIAFVSLAEGIDATTAAHQFSGRCSAHCGRSILISS